MLCMKPLPCSASSRHCSDKCHAWAFISNILHGYHLVCAAMSVRTWHCSCVLGTMGSCLPSCTLPQDVNNVFVCMYFFALYASLMHILKHMQHYTLSWLSCIYAVERQLRFYVPTAGKVELEQPGLLRQISFFDFYPGKRSLV